MSLTTTMMKMIRPMNNSPPSTAPTMIVTVMEKKCMLVLCEATETIITRPPCQ